MCRSVAGPRWTGDHYINQESCGFQIEIATMEVRGNHVRPEHRQTSRSWTGAGCSPPRRLWDVQRLWHAVPGRQGRTTATDVLLQEMQHARTSRAATRRGT